MKHLGRGPRPPARKVPRGFTLLEMLVAVGILATALTAVVSVGATYADSAGYLRLKTLALWVAHNRMSEIELTPVFPADGKSDDDVQMGGVTWTWRAEVTETQDPTLRRVDVTVERKDEKSKQKGSYVSLTGFISQAGRTTP